MKTDLINANPAVNVSLDGLIVEETLHTGILKNGQKNAQPARQQVFAAADLWNCQRQMKVRRSALSKILN